MKTGNFELGGGERVTCHRSDFAGNSEFCFPSTSAFYNEVVVETKLTVSRGLVIKCLLTHDT